MIKVNIDEKEKKTHNEIEQFDTRNYYKSFLVENQKKQSNSSNNFSDEDETEFKQLKSKK